LDIDGDVAMNDIFPALLKNKIESGEIDIELIL